MAPCALRRRLQPHHLPQTLPALVGELSVSNLEGAQSATHHNFKHCRSTIIGTTCSGKMNWHYLFILPAILRTTIIQTTTGMLLTFYLIINEIRIE